MMKLLARYDVWLAYDLHDATSDWDTLKEVLSE
jgi:hypothetical protein